VQGSSSTIRALVIRGFTGNGLVLRGHLNTVERCVIGLNYAATEKKANAGHGILIDNASGNLIGDLGNSTNIISGNGKNGIHIQGFGADENFILGNIIGFNPDDNQNVGNGGHGVAIHGGKGNWVGSELALLRNYIGGNISNGIHIAGTAAGSSFIVGNRIGFGFFFVMGNANGIEVHASSKHLIGGVSSNSHNIISGNLKNGIYIHGFAHDNKIQGNLIGLHKYDFDPPTAGGNYEDGIRISDASNGTIIGGSTTQRGFGAGNTIVGNRGYGISIDRQCENTVIEGNAIGTDRQSGTKRLGNGQGGIRTLGPNTRIGGSKEAQGNLISGHDFGGIFVEGLQAATIIQGNKIGVTIGGGGINLNSDDLGRSFFEIKVTGGDKVWIGGELPAGTQFGQPPGNIVGGGITFEAVSASAIFGNSIGLNFQGEFLSAARVHIEGWRNWVGSPRGSNEISGGVTLRGSKNVLQGNRLGITRSGSVITENETQSMVHLASAGDSLIGGRRPGEANSVIGGREGVWVDCIGANGIFGNEIRGFKEVAITTNKLPALGTAPPVIVDATPDNLFSSDGLANVRFAPFAPGEFGEIEVFGSSATGLLNPKPDALKLVGRATIPRDGTLSNVIVRLREVGFDELTATVTKKGWTTSPLSERVRFGILADADSDGIPDALETLGDGDANNDGIQDKQQGNVWGFPAYNGGGSVTVEMKTPGSLGFARSREDLLPPIIPDKSLRLDMAYPLELQIRLPAQDGKTGKASAPGVARLEIFPPAGTQPNAFLIYKDFQWSEFTYDGTTGAQILPDRVVLHFVDDERGDEGFFPEKTIQFKGILATILATPPPLRIQEVQKAPGDEIFLRYSGPSDTYWIEESANLSSWTSILTNPPSASDASLFVPASTNNARFFRVIKPAAPQ
jgi:hypothetical protein